MPHEVSVTSSTVSDSDCWRWQQVVRSLPNPLFCALVGMGVEEIIALRSVGTLVAPEDPPTSASECLAGSSR
jgi:hypothetical protein